MGQPTFVQKIDASNANASSLTLTPSAATTAGNLLLVGILLNANGAQTPAAVAGIIDSAGTPVVAGISTGVPVNTWTPLASNSDDGVFLQWWICKGAVSITDLVISLTYPQSIIAFAMEYNSANGITNPIFQTLLSNQNTITTEYIKETASTFPNSGAQLMIGLFAMLGDTFNATPLEGTNRATNDLNIPPALSYQVLENGTVDETGLLNLTAVSATQLATVANVGTSTMQCFYLLISGGLVLNTPPGLSDQPDASLTVGEFALGIQLAKISGNAALGMTRMEFFQGVYTNGETVDLPVSPVDGYEYQQNELTYVWGIYSTCNTGNGWITGPQALWYAQWGVDQETGLVSSEEWYRADGAAGISNDGYLQVFTIAQRQQQTLQLAEIPTYTDLPAAIFKTDLAYSEDLMIDLNNNSKFTVVGQECISMGEFYNGQTVPTPVSPADDYAYSYGEVTFIFSWRWTTGQLGYVQLACPPYYTLASLNAAISSSGVVTCAVGMMGDGGENYTSYNALGRIAVFALCQRQPRWSVPWNAAPWDNVGGKNASFIIGSGLTANNPDAGGYGGPYSPAGLQIGGPTIIKVTAGQTYILSYVGGTIPVHNSYGTLIGPLGEVGTTEAGVTPSPGSYVSGGPNTSQSCIGCYTDALGNIVGSPFVVGTAPLSLTIPSGATQIQLGNNDSYGSWPITPTYANYNQGAWQFLINRYVPVVGNKFAEIDNSLFYPGEAIPAGIAAQINQNILEASLSPEFFGPTLYAPGATIPTPVSPLDGYAYSRAELTYIWEWAEMTPGGWPPNSGSNNRTAMFAANINQSTGVITNTVVSGETSYVIWRLEPGGPYQAETTNGKISVTVVGFRAAQQTAITTPATVNTPPSDTGSAITDQPTQTQVFINGV
jgi:hypothetical protein